MTEKPILFSAPMVRAILDGTKTQMRRVCKPQPKNRPVRGLQEKPGQRCVWYDADCINPGIPMKCPYGFVGGRIWVRETWTPQDGMTMEARERDTIIYRADGEVNKGEYPNWRPSIHMPRWASRITLEITGVRVERVNEISEEDAKAEGDSPIRVGYWKDGRAGGNKHAGGRESFIEGFGTLWDSINSARPGCSWIDNPWVWVIEFRRIQP